MVRLTIFMILVLEHVGGKTSNHQFSKDKTLRGKYWRRITGNKFQIFI